MKEKITSKGITRKLFNIVLALTLVFSLMPINSITAYAALEEDAMCTSNPSANHWICSSVTSTGSQGT